MKKAIYVLGSDAYDRIYGPDERADIAAMVALSGEPRTPQSVKDSPAALAEAEIVLSGWGGPKMDEEFLRGAPALKAVFYGAGSIRGIVTEAFWRRGIVISSAWGANAIPVTEYTLSQILWGLKRGWHHVRLLKAEKAWKKLPSPGAYGSTVGLISLGQIGRRMCALLRNFDVKVLVCDPFATAEQAEALGAELCSLPDLFARSDVVSLHAPNLEETRGMITGELLASMKEGATFINTARGAIVREQEMIRVLQDRPDLQAVLDVTHPEPPAPDSPLWTLENVALTPHLAGSIGTECHRQGRYVVDELRRYLAGEPLQFAITEEQARILA